MNEIITFWQVAGILLGFQVTAFTFRLNRELQFPDRTQRWFPLADFLNILSMLITTIFVFAIPIAQRNNINIDNCYFWFGVAMIIFVFYPIALIAHYDLLGKKKEEEQRYTTKQEFIVIIIALLSTIIYTIYAW
ncbi:hypothetical protein [Haliscomenobacter hydrossis]|uniref:Uncharacterized protein n=1 Tax=Haliscomenobacter hydrossis (strain ATCC 27775 / DSM 1100 / LMG 10767 / O) TaxID=760192 RepID=F4KR54_HALH1|nr:hypothetical protein [Haliscomenobacter hydrossis]AEE53292.1 hypothetical protein Halhy_5467 [Haliscomenobacter hydrossis DSM 1100]